MKTMVFKTSALTAQPFDSGKKLGLVGLEPTFLV
jgi:hypothetical protein